MHQIKMKRRKSRESAFLILFEKMFNDFSIDQIIENGKLLRGLDTDDFTLETVDGVLSNIESIDQVIANNATNWKKERISKVSLTILRIGAYEIMFNKDVPTNVAVNEAVELSKVYSTAQDTAFINGVLGGIAKKGC